MSGPKRPSGLGPSARLPLLKQRSWSPDTERDEAWTKRKGLHRNRQGQLSRSVSDEDLDELRGCLDLGFFGFEVDSPAAEKLSQTFPALDLYCAINRSLSNDSSSANGSPVASPLSIVSPGDTPELVKARLKQWAQVVACSLRQRY